MKTNVAVRITLDEAKLNRLLSKTIEQRFVWLGGSLVRYARQLVSKGPGRGPRGPRGGKKKSMRGKVHSAPGQPPFVQTGMLRQSINFAIGRSGRHPRLYIGVVEGTADNYARELELGRPHMAPRPFLIPTLRHNRVVLRQVFGVYK